MRAELFEEWLRELDREIRRKGGMSLWSLIIAQQSHNKNLKALTLSFPAKKYHPPLHRLQIKVSYKSWKESTAPSLFAAS